MLDRDVIITGYRDIAAIAMTLSVLEGHLLFASFVKWDVLNICALIDKVSTDKCIT